MKNLLQMDIQALLSLSPSDIDRSLTPEEVLHIAKVTGALWSFDYQAAEEGLVGLHAELKSGLHSDAFFVSKILLAHENIRRIMSDQIVRRIREFLDKTGLPDYVAGIPDGATKLGEDIAEILGVKNAKMEKVDGGIRMVTDIAPGESVLFIEDFCTRGTGFKEACAVTIVKQPQVRILPYDPAILNRGGLKTISVEGVGEVEIPAVVEKRVQDWEPGPGKCALCDMGSQPIKPKASDENWQAITTSQLPAQ